LVNQSNPSTIAASSQIGAVLRDARNRLGEDLPSAAEALRIRLVYLQAIEDGRFGELPGATYAVGFVRSYADHLGLDSDEIVRRFRNEVADGLAKPTQLVFPSPASEGRLPGLPMMLLGVLLAAAAYGGWYHWSQGEPKVAEMVAPAPESAKPQVAEPLAAIPRPPVPSAAAPVVPSPGQAARNDLVPPADEDMDDVPAAWPIAPEAAKAPLGLPPAPPVAKVAATPAAPAVPDDVGGDFGGRVYGQTNEGSRVTLRAVEDAWIQVRDKNGDLLLARLLAKGDSFRVPNRPGISLVTGNAGGLEVLVDGKAAPRLGQVGVVRRDIALDAEALMGTGSVR